MKKRIKLIMTVSILGNILLGGALVGMIMDRQQDTPWNKLKEGLSPESQKLVTEMFQSAWKDMGPVMRQSMDNRNYLAEVVAAEEFNAARFDEAVKRVRGVQDLMAKKKIESTKELLIKLPAADRKKLAEQVANSFTWKGGHRGKRPHDYPQPPRDRQDDGAGED